MLEDVSLEIIQKCLNNCVYCSSNSCYTSKAILNLTLIKNVIDGITFMGAKRLCLSGGEPFLHPNIVEIVSYAASKGLIVDIYSSGIVGERGDEQSIADEMFCKCKRAGLNRIMFNLQTTHAEIYDAIMQTHNNFENTLDSIKRARKHGIETEIHFVPMKQNFKEIKNIVKLAKELGVCQVSFLKLVSHGRAKINENEIVLNKDEELYIQNKLYSIKQKGENIRIGLPLLYPEKDNNCHAVKEKLYIKFDGSVFGCEAFKYIKFWDENGEEINPDSVYDRGIREIRNDSAFLKKSSELVNKYACQKVGCDNCPVQKYMKERGNGNV